MLNRKKIPILYCDIISLCDVPVGFHQMNEFSCISFSWQNSCAKADNQQTYSKELGVLIQAETQLTMYGSMCNNFSLQRRNQGDVFRGREGNLIHTHFSNSGTKFVGFISIKLQKRPKEYIRVSSTAHMALLEVFCYVTIKSKGRRVDVTPQGIPLPWIQLMDTRRSSNWNTHLCLRFDNTKIAFLLYTGQSGWQLQFLRKVGEACKIPKF